MYLHKLSCILTFLVKFGWFLQVRNDDNIMAPQPASGDLFPEPPIKIRNEDLFTPPTKIVDPPPKVNDL